MESFEEKLRFLENKINISSTSLRIKKIMLSIILSIIVVYIYKPSYIYKIKIKNKKVERELKKDKFAIFLIIHTFLVFIAINIINKYI